MLLHMQPEIKEGVCAVSPLGEQLLLWLYWSAGALHSGWRSWASLKSWQFRILTLCAQELRCLRKEMLLCCSLDLWHLCHRDQLGAVPCVCPAYWGSRRTGIFNHSNIICLACRDQKVVIISGRENANLKWDNFKAVWGFFNVLSQALIWVALPLLPSSCLLSLQTVIAVLALSLPVVSQCYFLVCSSFNGSNHI